MTTIPDLCPVLQHLLTDTANDLARRSGFIERSRKVSGAGFVQTLVFGFMAYPAATRRQLHQTAVKAGMALSVQGLDKRFDARAVTFLRQMLEVALAQVVSSPIPRPLLPRFNGVYVTDGSQVTLGDTRLKLAVRLELQAGQLQVSLDAYSTHDGKTAIMAHPLPASSLHLGDLGFFNLKRFQQWNAQQVAWLSRFKVGTCLYDEAGQPIDLIQSLQTADPTALNRPVQVGQRDRVKAYLVAQRVAPEVYARRLAQFKELRRRQHPVSEAKIVLAGWTIYLTNIPDLSFEQAHILARTRWQIELVFKQWKFHARLTRSTSSNPQRQACEGYAKLLAVLLAHWTLLLTGWEHIDLSQVQAFHLIQSYAHQLLDAFRSRSRFMALLKHIRRSLSGSARLASRRKRPATFQLWLDFETLSA